MHAWCEGRGGSEASEIKGRGWWKEEERLGVDVREPKATNTGQRLCSWAEGDDNVIRLRPQGAGRRAEWGGPERGNQDDHYPRVMLCGACLSVRD